MAIVTFLSDFGDQDYYVPAVKAKLLAVNPQLNIIDLSHNIEQFELAHAAFVLKSTFRDFPKGTVHLVAINTTSSFAQGYIGIQLEDHIFVAPNNGILSLLSDQNPAIMVQLDDFLLMETSFPTKDILAPIAAKVASGAALTDFGIPLTNFRKIMPTQAKATREQISGHVLRVDRYGNVITNIERKVFETLNPGKYKIGFGRESLTKLHIGYDQVEPGDCFAFFNSVDLLEIGIHHGHGGNLLGLKYDSVVSITFES